MPKVLGRKEVDAVFLKLAALLAGSKAQSIYGELIPFGAWGRFAVAF